MESMALDVASLLETLTSRAPPSAVFQWRVRGPGFLSTIPLASSSLVLADTRPQEDTEEAKQNREQQAEKALVRMEGIADAICLSDHT